jgi:hypothetical protein
MEQQQYITYQKNRREEPTLYWSYYTPNRHFQAINCDKCGNYIRCSLFCSQKNGINNNYFLLENKHKHLQCQCAFRPRVSLNPYAEICYNCGDFDCNECVYETDHEDNLSEYDDDDDYEFNDVDSYS